MLIYKVTNIITGKSYIGQTIQSLEKRKKGHKKFILQAKLVFHKALFKYGWDNFIWEILEDNIETKECLNERETFYILKYDTYAPNGYNVTVGGNSNSGYHHSDETKRLFSEQHSGSNHVFFGKKRPEHAKLMKAKGKLGELHYNYGRKHTDEERHKISKGNTGKVRTDEYKLHLSLINKGKVLSEETKQRIKEKRKLQTFSEETRQRMRLAHLGLKLSKEACDKISRVHKGKVVSKETRLKLSNYHKKKVITKLISVLLQLIGS